MKKFDLAAKVFSVSATCLAISALLTTGVQAQVVNKTNPNMILDQFKSLTYNPSTTLPWDYWWVTLENNDVNGFTRAENVPCSVDNSICVKAMNDGDTTFARLSETHQQYPGGFVLAELSAERDGFTYGQTHRWLPTVGHPVVFSEKVRWGANYQADGSGTVGSSGVYLWNAPIDLINNAFNAPLTMGFQFSQKGTKLSNGPSDLGGLYALALDFGTNPYAPVEAAIPVRNINIHDWNELSTQWSVNAQGVQRVDFFVNGNSIGGANLATPLPSLTEEIWNDNQTTQSDINGITYGNPSAVQNFDLGMIKVQQN